MFGRVYVQHIFMLTEITKCSTDHFYNNQSYLEQIQNGTVSICAYISDHLKSMTRESPKCLCKKSQDPVDHVR